MNVCTAETVIALMREKVGLPDNMVDIATLSWEDLGVDSLGLLEMVRALERTFAVSLSQEQVVQTPNVEALVALINAQTVSA
ncbi:MAG TPA: acyl carrier protein [Ktedonobacteraceae bacterium]|nr:acyl carrier protein [Ktedonobacteraceae bacterium]